MYDFRKNIYKEPVTGISKYLPWAIMAAPGTVLQKDGLLQKTIAFRGPDLDAATAESIATLSWQVNDAIKRLGTGWAVFFEAQRYATIEYPGSKHYNKAAFLVDEERRRAFMEYGLHYESSYYITFVKKLESEVNKKVTNVFMAGQDAKENVREEISAFVNVVKDIAGIIAARVDVQELDDAITLSYLHSSLSMDWHQIAMPDRMLFLDRVLPDSPIGAGTTIKVGEHFTPIIGVNDYPMETYPGILDVLNRAQYEYRWVTRYICLDKEDALKEIDIYQKKYYGARKGFKQLLGEAATKQESGRVNQGAMALESDAIAAQIEVTNDEVGYGYMTTCVQVWDTDEKQAMNKATAVKQIIQQNGFVCKIETFNAFQAWLGMMPGNVYANIRRPLVSTGNMSQVIPLTAIWAGDKLNHFFNEAIGDGTPHITCSTKFGTPFYLSLAVGDVMHTFIAGPSGAGKSVLLGALAIQWLRYENARVIIFDKDRSAKQLTQAVGGAYHEPGTSRVAFQPLADMESEEDIIWASEFVELLMELQNQEVNTETRSAIYDGLVMMRGIEREKRTLTSFQQYVQNNNVKDALRWYTLEGPYGTIFDANECTIAADDWIMIEMDPLMKLGNGAVMPALMYLFHVVDGMFDGRPTLLILDEAWLFLQHKIFQKQMQNWLKTLRKKKVAVVFATQEIADAVKSDIMATILQQCHTKIYLPDPEAVSPTMKESYKGFGLTEGEIGLIARGRKKADYFYKSSKGTRLFRLDLGPLALALITGQDHEFLSTIEGSDEQLMQILERKGIADVARKYLEENPDMDTRFSLTPEGEAQ